MKFSKDKQLSDVIYIEPTLFGDDRGYFFEAHHHDKFKENGITCNFVQSNQSKSSKGVLRGLHLQRSPKQQAKLVRVLEGQILDVAVDVRPNSPTFGQWTSYELNSELHNMLFIPEDFAHGFYVLSESATVFYQCSNTYEPNLEVSLRYDDPALQINWNLTETAILSPKDQNGLKLEDLAELLTQTKL